METSSRTVFGSYIQTCLALGLPPSYPSSSTLNEKLGINASTLPSTSDQPKLAYFAIGNRGHSMTIGSNGIAKPEPIQHEGTDAALYGQIPFVLRTLNNDLTQLDRAKYALRRIESRNNIQYAAYYLKRIDLSAVTPQMFYNTVSNGSTTTTPFVPNSTNLNPTPPSVNNSGVNTVSGDYTTASALLNLALSASDAQEILNVATIMFGDSGFAIISEIALCFGVDKVVTISGNGGGFNMNEAIGVTIAEHIPAFYPLNFSDTGVTVSLNVGSSDPLFALTNV